MSNSSDEIGQQEARASAEHEELVRSAADMADRFDEKLKEASRIVATWPAWKRNVLGTLPEKKNARTKAIHFDRYRDHRS